MALSVLNTVKIEVDQKYKWKDTLFLDKYTASENEESLKRCKKTIRIKYSKKITYSEARQIEENIFACDKYIYDKEKNAKITFVNDDECIIESNQEVNEWLVIMLQIMLVQEGYSFIHAAAVANDKGECLLMPSWGGVGKTATVSKLVDKGYKLLGDDLNILSDKGKIYGFPKKFVLYYYHKNLFPEVFKEKNIKCNSKLNNVYSTMIPAVKRTLRKIPGALAYARKHNPQSMKVSPHDIFGSSKIAKEAKIKEVFWLERAIGKDYKRTLPQGIVVSKAVSVTQNEIFNDNLNAVLIMCGMGLISYDTVFKRMSEIYQIAFGKSPVKEICVDRKKPVECVADKVVESITI